MLAAALVLAGCSSEIDENKPVEMVKVEASKMKPEALKEKIAEYQGLIAEKQTGIKGIETKIKNLSISDLMGEQARTLKAEMGDLTASLEKLSAQMAVFADELAAGK